ncbi:YbfB/YjiJ family MFS transporter [Histidinibacterium lentulum]|uniref:YbfB/YjiJ family MFS transporter n=1 Tax=Histidinibacterium lentulum TaxID=2480588 RepID=A0A3N2QYA4_9RHOB|nr:YbfB/YjiJ family MFS transporter [Histidinibacterium lentulum]ROU00170.1 YbfB/YjiJ family MFS transporter [Histidinibacterium lentulum]
MMSKDATAWLVVAGLSLGPAVSNGLSRFSYGLILPAMQADLSWSFTEAGWLNTANAVGYLLGAVSTLALIDRVGPRRILSIGVAATPVALVGSAVFADLWMQSVFRVAAGIAGAGIFISGGAMAATLFRGEPTRNALAISLYFGGGGLGMIASGAVLPVLFDRYGVGAWPTAWLILAGLSALAVWPALRAARECPEPARVHFLVAQRLPVMRMIPAVLGYFLFAVGYIVYLTFLVALMHEGATRAGLIAACWTLLGLGVIAAPFAWRDVVARSAGGGPLALACLATGAATLLPIGLPGSVPALVASVVIFGLSFFIAPTAVTSFARKNLDQSAWGRAVGMFTAVFALGQILGPVLAGSVSDLTGSVAHGMGAAGLVLITGAALAALQCPLATRPIVEGA